MLHNQSLLLFGLCIALSTASVGCSGIAEEDPQDAPQGNIQKTPSTGGVSGSKNNAKPTDEVCSALSFSPKLPNLTLAHSNDPLPLAKGGTIPIPSTFILQSFRRKGKYPGFDTIGGSVLRFVSSEFVDVAQGYITGSTIGYKWHHKTDTRIFLVQHCPGKGRLTLTYDYTFENGLLTVTYNDDMKVYKQVE